MKKTKQFIEEIFKEEFPKHSDNSKAEQEENEMKKYLKNLIDKIDDCLKFMSGIGKSEENSCTFNNLSVLKKQIEKATKNKEVEFCTQLNNLSNIGKIVCRKKLSDTGRDSGKRLALNSNLINFNTKAKKWSKELIEWYNVQKNHLVKERSKNYK